MRVKTFVSTIGLVLISALVSAQKVTYDYNKRADFSRYKSYAWVRGTTVDDPLLHARIVGALNEQLAGEGLTMVDSPARADVIVAYHASLDRDLQITGFSTGWGGFRFPGSFSGVARTDEILTGTLIVDLIDARTHTIVWRGTATQEIDLEAKPAKRDKSIARTAEKLFKQYPPAD